VESNGLDLVNKPSKTVTFLWVQLLQTFIYFLKTCKTHFIVFEIFSS